MCSCITIVHLCCDDRVILKIILCHGQLILLVLKNMLECKDELWYDKDKLFKDLRKDKNTTMFSQINLI